MPWGLIISAVFHVGILAYGLVAFSSPREFRVPKNEPMAVSIITSDELTRLKQGARNAKQREAFAKRRAKKTKINKRRRKNAPRAVRAMQPPPPADPIAAALAKLPKPDPQARKKKQAAKKAAIAKAQMVKKALAKVKANKLAAAKKKALAKRKAQLKRKKALARKKKLAKKHKLERLRKKKLAAKRRKAKLRKARLRKERERKRLAALAKKRKKKKSFDADRLATLLNKLPDDAAPLSAAQKKLRRRKRASRGLGAPEGRDKRLTASEIAVLQGMIQRQLAQCWSLPGAGGGSTVARVRLSWRLQRNGMLDGEPRVIGARSDVFGRIAQEAAIRAVKTCQPFQLPADKYHVWQQIEEWEFDPSQMR